MTTGACGKPDARQRARPVWRAEAGKRSRSNPVTAPSSDPTSQQSDYDRAGGRRPPDLCRGARPWSPRLVRGARRPDPGVCQSAAASWRARPALDASTGRADRTLLRASLRHRGMRRTHLRGHTNILKRLLVHAGGFNLGLVMRHLIGSGTPRGLQDRLAPVIATLSSLMGATRHWLVTISAWQPIMAAARPVTSPTTTTGDFSAVVTYTTGC